jgi:hypothetical protein
MRDHVSVPALALSLFVVGCGNPDLGAVDADEEEVEGTFGATALSTVTRLAPAVHLHSQESHLPMSAATFIARSRLRWSHDSACLDHQLAGAGSVSSRDLGAGRYSHQVAGDITCSDHGDRIPSNAKVRPRDGVAGNEGFFLDMDDGARGGAGTSAPVYYEYVPGRYVTYWFLYGNSRPPGPSAVTGLISHEGDWERISVRLNRNDEPTEVAFYAHHGYATVSWAAVQKRGTHPVVYSGKGSHASYATPGGHSVSFAGLRFSDETDKGSGWSTWQNLYNARSQGWYGYGGAWGEVGELKDTTGPMGPSVHKGSAPSGW